MSIKIIPYDPDETRLLHHVALCPRDVDESIRFYQEGIGLQRILDEEISGNWRQMFNARSDKLRTIFFGDPERPTAGIVELVVFDGGHDDMDQPAAPANGFFLLSFLVNVPQTLERLAALGLDRNLKVEGAVVGESASIATVRDPDGTLVELIPIGMISDTVADLAND